jgi:NhaA family Na+:H+ antiporter
LLNRLGVRAVGAYVVVGAVIWFCFLKSGVHPTVAGVLLGLLTPPNAWFDRLNLFAVMEAVRRRLSQDAESDEDHREEAVQVLTTTARETIAPLDRLETALHPWVAFGIMPLFALANAGVVLDLSSVVHPVALAVGLGLVVGKPLGILAFSGAAVGLGLARLPSAVNWKMLCGGSCLAGIGFTMSLFVAGLALQGSTLEAGKMGVLVASIISAAVGMTLLVCCSGSGRGESAKKKNESNASLQGVEI